MPLLNPGIVVSSAYLSDDISIIRRAQTVGSDGMSSVTPSTSSSWAIVCNAGPNDLQRLPEAARAGRIMMFITNAQVQPIGPSNQPDLILWPISGSTSAHWVVLDVGPYPNYGEGWYQVLAASQDIEDVPL